MPPEHLVDHLIELREPPLRCGEGRVKRQLELRASATEAAGDLSEDLLRERVGLRQARAAAAAARGASGHAHAHDAQHEEGCRCSLQASRGPGRRRERQAQGTDVIR